MKMLNLISKNKTITIQVKEHRKIEKWVNSQETVVTVPIRKLPYVLKESKLSRMMVGVNSRPSSWMQLISQSVNN
jgi:hypothetical protein